MHPNDVDIAAQQVLKVDFHTGLLEQVRSHFYADVHIAALLLVAPCEGTKKHQRTHTVLLTKICLRRLQLVDTFFSVCHRDDDNRYVCKFTIIILMHKIFAPLFCRFTDSYPYMTFEKRRFAPGDSSVGIDQPVLLVEAAEGASADDLGHFPLAVLPCRVVAAATGCQDGGAAQHEYDGQQMELSPDPFCHFFGLMFHNGDTIAHYISIGRKKWHQFSF